MSEVKEVTRMNKGQLRELVLSTALTIATRDGFNALTRDGIATEAGVSMGQVNHAYGTMTQLRNAVMRAAVLNEHLSVIAHGLAIGHSQAHKAPEWLQEKAALSTMRKG